MSDQPKPTDALAAEKHRCEVIHRHAETIDLLKKQLAAERERPCSWCESERDEVLRQLAAAQATIKKAHFRFRPPPGDTAALAAAIAAAQQPLVDALEFYQRREHWMALTDEVDAPQTNLVAHGKHMTTGNGYDEADAALAKAGK